MAQAGFTPISLYFSSTAAAVPTSGNLANGELALNIADMKLYAKNSAGVVTLLASNAATTGVDSLSFGSTGLTPSTATTGAITVAGTLNVANGGTGKTSYTANGILYASGTGTLANGSSLTFDGTNFATTGSVTVGTNTRVQASSGILFINGPSSVAFENGAGSENMRLNTTGLGIGTNSPATTLQLGATGVGSASGSNSIGKFRIQKPIDALSSPFGTRMIDLYAYYPGFENSNPSSTIYSGVEAGSSTQNGYFAVQTLLANVLTERVRVDSGGNVGIGTSSPTSIGGYTVLEVNGNTSGSILDMAQNDVMRGRFVAVSAAFTIETNTAIPINFSPAGVERFRFATSGQLGIGGANYGTAGQVLTSGGASAAPTWATAAAGGTTMLFAAFSSTGESLFAGQGF